MVPRARTSLSTLGVTDRPTAASIDKDGDGDDAPAVHDVSDEAEKHQSRQPRLSKSFLRSFVASWHGQQGQQEFSAP
jgi:hypothetical protein